METARLILRPHVPEDFEDYYAYIMDEELQHMLGLHDVTARDSAQETFDWLLANSRFLAIVLKETGRPIGHISIQPAYAEAEKMPTLKGKTGADLTFAISRDYRRRGLMEEALRCLIRSLLEEDGVDYLSYEYASFNQTSQSLQRKLGFLPFSSQPFEDITLYTCILTSTEFTPKEELRNVCR